MHYFFPSKSIEKPSGVASRSISKPLFVTEGLMRTTGATIALRIGIYRPPYRTFLDINILVVFNPWLKFPFNMITSTSHFIKLMFSNFSFFALKSLDELEYVDAEGFSATSREDMDIF
jgi:hypothetical protein